MKIAIISNYYYEIKNNTGFKLGNKIYSKTYFYIMTPFRNNPDAEEIVIDFFIQDYKISQGLTKIIDTLKNIYNKNINIKNFNEITNSAEKYDELYVDNYTYNYRIQNAGIELNKYANKIKNFEVNLQECDSNCTNCGCYKQLGNYNGKNKFIVDRIAPRRIPLFSNKVGINDSPYKILIINDFSYFTDKIDHLILSPNQEIGKLLKSILYDVRNKTFNDNEKRKEFDNIFADVRVMNAINCVSNINNLNPAVSLHTNFGKNGASFVEEEIKAYKPDYIIVFGAKAFSAIKLENKSYITFSNLRGRIIEDSICGHQCKIFGTISPYDVFNNHNLSSVFFHDLKYLSQSLVEKYDEVQKKIVESDKLKYMVINDSDKIKELIRSIYRVNKNNTILNIAVDIETNSLKSFKGLNDSIDPRITVISLCFDKKVYSNSAIGYGGKETLLIPYDTLDDESKFLVKKLIIHIFCNKNYNKFLHNAPYDLTFLERIFKTKGKLATYSKNLYDNIVLMNNINEEHIKGFKTLDNLAALFTNYGTYYYNMYEYKERFSKELSSYVKEFNKTTITKDTYGIIKKVINSQKEIIANVLNKKITDFKSLLFFLIKDDYIYYLLKNVEYCEKKIKLNKISINITTFFNYILLYSILNDKNQVNQFTNKNIEMNGIYKFSYYMLNKFFGLKNIKMFSLSKDKIDRLIEMYNNDGRIVNKEDMYFCIDKFIEQYKNNIDSLSVKEDVFNKIGFTQNILRIYQTILNNMIIYDDQNNKISVKDMLDYGDLEKQELYSYTAFDVKATLEGGIKYLKHINSSKNTRISSAIVNEVLKVIVNLQTNGIRIDKTKFYSKKEEYENKLKELELEIINNPNYDKHFNKLEEMYGLPKTEFNIRSTDHVAKLMYAMGVERTGVLVKSVKENTIVNEETLENIIKLREHQRYKKNTDYFHAANIAETILGYRKTNKIYSTYIDGLLKNGLIDDNFFCYPNYNAIGTRTGRFSSSNPNLQNIPSEVKDLYVSRFNDEFVTGRLIQADYSQIELRVAAMYSECKGLTQAFRNGEDIHMATAKLISHVPYLCKDTTILSGEEQTNIIEVYKKHNNNYSLSDSEVLKNIEEETKYIRRVAKTINFGIIYGISDFSIAKRLGIKQEDAEMFKKKYIQAYSEIKDYMDKMQENATKYGKVSTYFKRLRNVKNARMYSILYDQIIDEIKTDPDKNRCISKEDLGVFRSYKSRAGRQAINAPIQSTASDFTLLSLISLNHFLSNEKIEINDKTYQPVICGTVHDSIIIDCPDRKDDTTFTKTIIEKVKEIMSDPLKYFIDNIVEDIKYLGPEELNQFNIIRNKYVGDNDKCVPIEADVEVGDNWRDVSPNLDDILSILPEIDTEIPEYI